jgi:hypothetical protein
LERQIAEFHGREDSILYASCFDANAGFFEALLTPRDAVLSDELNHASIIDGIRLCKAQKYRYKHMDMAGWFFQPSVPLECWVQSFRPNVLVNVIILILKLQTWKRS